MYKCTCPCFLDYRYCKHALAYALVKGEMTVPKAKDMTIIGKTAKKGRPKGTGMTQTQGKG